jgi:hypothetical protein
MSTLKSAILTLCLLLAPAALAQTPPVPTPTPPPAPANATPAVPPQEIEATRHHQPTQADVNALEAQRLGKGQLQQQSHDQADVDKLYDQLMRETAPKNGAH